MSAEVDSPVGAGSSLRVAFCLSNHIGDTLVSLVIVRHLQATGAEVTVFGTPAYALRRWFSGYDIRPLPAFDAITTALASFDRVIQMHGHQPYEVADLVHPQVSTLQAVECAPGRDCMAERFKAFSETEFGPADIGLDNGLTPPPGLQHRRHLDRVVIHPEANADDKRWLPERFVRLASRLRARGHEVVFVIAPHERHRWSDLPRHDIAAPQWDDLDALAAFVYESGWFIGNDSGIGHLASNLGVPTLSLFRRRGVADRWRPAWGTAAVVLPWRWLPGAHLKERYWRQALTCGGVLRAFDRLQRRVDALVSPAAATSSRPR